MPTSKDGKEDNRPRKFNIKKHQKILRLHDETIDSKFSIKNSLKLAIEYWKKKMKKAVGELTKTCEQRDADYIGLKYLQEFVEQEIDKCED